MPTCPECRATYDPGVVLCRDCRVPLVPAEELERGEREWVSLAEVRTLPNAVTAAMWKGALESQGLHPIVRSHAIPAYGEVLRDWTTRAWGTLLVPEDELAEARLVLEDFLATAASSAPGDDDEAEAGLDDRGADP